MLKSLLFTLSFLLASRQLLAQCVPPFALDCASANILCSLQELNGYCCSTPNFSNPSGCAPLCPSGGNPENVAWYAFITKGGQANIQVNVSNCQVNNQGLEMGLWADCNCVESVVCQSGCNGAGIYTLSANLKACTKYYLFIDGCNGDVCQYCLTVTGGLPMQLPSSFTLVGPRFTCTSSNRESCFILEPRGQCMNIEYTVDGVLKEFGDGEYCHRYKQAGEYEICATAHLGFPNQGYQCAVPITVCTTLVVVDKEIRNGPIQFLCNESIPYQWHSQIINESGLYAQEFTDKSIGCKFDSVREFVILEAPLSQQIYHIGCSEEDPYIDPVSKISFKNCHNDLLIVHRNVSLPFRCDSNYLLNSVILDLEPRFKVECDSGRLKLSVQVLDQTNLCGHSEIKQKFSYKWYLKSDSLKIGIDTNSITHVNKADNYCLQLRVNTLFGPLNKICSFEWCENINETTYLPGTVCVIGPREIKHGDTLTYQTDSILPRADNKQFWHVIGGKILSPDEGRDTSKIQVLWQEFSSERSLCYSYQNDCGKSDTCCLQISVVSAINREIVTDSDLVLVPNPASSGIRIVGNQQENIKSVFFYSLDGKLSHKISGLDCKPECDLLFFPIGIYIVRIETDHSTIFKKLTVIR